uniref:Potassium channel domain-containing protein n=1 Tax=Oryzias latipes TaxID=8090 RepID=A0A3P9IYF6_ORYLA
MSAGSGCEKCAAPLWRVFPHLALCGTLVAYAVLGALIFQRIEGGNKPSKIQEDYREFLGEIVDIVRNHSQNTSCSQSCIVEQVEKKMKKFNSIWFQNPDNWTFFGSMFFCCTVFTTVGYGEIYPVTLSGSALPKLVTRESPGQSIGLTSPGSRRWHLCFQPRYGGPQAPRYSAGASQPGGCPPQVHPAPKQQRDI